MSLRVRCLLCREVLDCGQENTLMLLDHVREKHPNINIIRVSDQISESSLQPNKIAVDPPNEPLPKRMSHTSQSSLKKTPSQHSKSEIIVTDTIASGPPNPDRSTLGDPNLVFLSRNFRECHCKMDDVKEESPKRRSRDPVFVTHRKLDAPLQMDNSASAASKPSFYRYLSEAKKRIARRDHNMDQVIYERKGVPMEPLMPTRRRSRRKLYKTSIEKWRPGNTKITCPRCGSTRTPTIRKQSQRVTRNPLGAACILTLWPFCFMPCMFAAPTQEFLHCSKCEFRFGEYDQRNGRAIASHESLHEVVPQEEEVGRPMKQESSADGLREEHSKAF